MAKYLFSGSYTPEGLRGVIAAGGTARVNAVKKLAESVGGSVESMYFAFGTNDFYIVVDAPDHVSSAAVSLTVNAAGAVRATCTVLLTPEEVDQATRRSPMYVPPGS